LLHDVIVFDLNANNKKVSNTPSKNIARKKKKARDVL